MFTKRCHFPDKKKWNSHRRLVLSEMTTIYSFVDKYIKKQPFTAYDFIKNDDLSLHVVRSLRCGNRTLYIKSMYRASGLPNTIALAVLYSPFRRRRQSDGG